MRKQLLYVILCFLTIGSVLAAPPATNTTSSTTPRVQINISAADLQTLNANHVVDTYFTPCALASTTFCIYQIHYNKTVFVKSYLYREMVNGRLVTTTKNLFKNGSYSIPDSFALGNYSFNDPQITTIQFNRFQFLIFPALAQKLRVPPQIIHPPKINKTIITLAGGRP